MDFHSFIDAAGSAIDLVGVLVIVIGFLLATASFLGAWRRNGFDNSYESYRRNLGRAILLGLEFLIAGDIVKSVTITPSIKSVVILGLIVLVRSFLSMELEGKIKGAGLRWMRGRK